MIVCGVVDRQRAGADRERDRQVAGRLVLAQRRRALRRERVDDRRDVRLLGDARPPPCSTASAFLASVSLPLLRVQHDRARAVGLVGERLRQRVGRRAGCRCRAARGCRWCCRRGGARRRRARSSRRSQTASTTKRRRTQNCASPYSTPVMDGRSPLKSSRTLILACATVAVKLAGRARRLLYTARARDA